MWWTWHSLCFHFAKCFMEVFSWIIFLSKPSYSSNSIRLVVRKPEIKFALCHSVTSYITEDRPLSLWDLLSCVYISDLYISYIMPIGKWIYLLQELKWFKHVILLKDVLYWLNMHGEKHLHKPCNINGEGSSYIQLVDSFRQFKWRIVSIIHIINTKYILATILVKFLIHFLHFIS